MSTTGSKSSKTSKTTKSSTKETKSPSPICCNETKVESGSAENTNTATHTTSSWFSKYSIENDESGETCHLKSGANPHLKQKMVPQTDLQKKTKVCIVFLALIVLCIIIGGIAVSVLKVHDDYTCILKTEMDNTVKRSNEDSLQLQASTIRRSSKEKRWCFICLRPLDDLVDTTTKLACGHEFHKDCVIDWLRTQNNCPLCKEPENIMLTTPAVVENIFD